MNSHWSGNNPGEVELFKKEIIEKYSVQYPKPIRILRPLGFCDV